MSEWLTKKVRGWTDSVEILTGVERRNLQIYFSDLQKLLQQEWYFFLNINPGVREVFQPVDEVPQSSFLLELFRGVTTSIQARGVTHLPVKQVGMVLPDITISTSENCMDSCDVTGNLVATLIGRTEFWMGDHALLLKEGCRDIRSRNVQNTQADL